MINPRRAALLAIAAAASAAAAQNCQNPVPGDANIDFNVDFTDLNAILSAWATADPALDLDGSGLIDFGDLNLVLANWGNQYCPYHTAIDVLPLPPVPHVEIDFADQPIPADFFGPGSEPFVGRIEFCGGVNSALPLILEPSRNPEDNLVLRRHDCIQYSPDVTTIDVEIVELSLTSCTSFAVVGISGTAGDWDVWVASVPAATPTGTATFTFEAPESGAGDLFIPFQPMLVFAPSEQVEAFASGDLPAEDVEIRVLEPALPALFTTTTPLGVGPSHPWWNGCDNAPLIEWSENKPYAWP